MIYNIRGGGYEEEKKITAGISQKMGQRGNRENGEETDKKSSTKNLRLPFLN